MNPAARRYIAIETAISAGINAGLSLAFTLLVFGGQGMLDLSARAVLLDMLPQGFMVAFMATLVPTLLTRRRMAAGGVLPLPGAPVRPHYAVLRALAAGILAGAAGTGLFALLGRHAIVPLAAFVAAKPLYGALLAAIITPLALHAALRDRVCRR